MVYDGSNLSPVLGRNLNLVEIRFTQAFFDVWPEECYMLMIGLNRKK